MLDLGRLLRAKNMVDSAAASVKPDAAAARGLTESYARLRAEILDLAAGSEYESEAARLFPEVGIAEPPNARLAGVSGRQFNVNLESEAKRAVALLGQLGGWLQGLIDEQLLERRIQAEAEAKAKLEARPQTGFTASS